MTDRDARRTTITAGLMLGIGLGGFLDGIVLHQILQWHNMLSSKIPPTDLVSMKYNMVWDGIFHLFTWVVTAIGVAFLWRVREHARKPATSILVGSASAGWGLFNVVEGLVDHQLLRLHHVRPGPAELAWDVGFLASGMALITGGYLAIARGGTR